MILLKEILLKINFVEFEGNIDTQIHEVIQLNPNNTNRHAIFWCNNKNIFQLNNCKYGTVICSHSAKKEFKINEDCNYIFVENPRLVFSKIIKDFFLQDEKAPYISQSAVIHPSAKIGLNVSIGHFTVIEENCIIEDNCKIGYNNTIHQKTHLHKNVKIGSNNTIGGIGFGYEKNEQGNYEILPHIGNVVIYENVEIGNNTCIDKAVLGSTKIHKNVKIDNLVHIAHGVEIGENSLIIANSMIGGSTKIGKNVWVAPSASLINKIEVNDNALIGLGAVVVKSVEESHIVAGNPAKFIKKNS